ncbi:MAG: TonB-dependent receptor [Saprospiraceae bacterium]|nr:TonB-dependent receptor [Saprospiraceae bacterium]
MHDTMEPEQKALEINLNDKIYGAFAEIGAGQEVARYFFQAGGAAGTIAKSMSAYDKIFSDKIYGPEEHGRYVCMSRLYKMLDHEYNLMESRLRESRPGTNFFVFADTISAINYQKTTKGEGWIGIRFQLSPNSKPNDLIVHVKMLDNDNKLQQQAVGILGVNMLYACYFKNDGVKGALRSFMDNLQGRVQVDMIRLNGDDFKHIDNRLLSLNLVKNNMTDVAMFGADGINIHPSEFLYKKQVLVVRGRFRPLNLVNEGMIEAGKTAFLEEEGVDPIKATVLTEMTIDDLMSEGSINKQDFLDRVTILNDLGFTVVISNCGQHQKLINYLLDYKINKIGFVMGIWHLQSIIEEKYEQNKDNRLLTAFGDLFTKQVKIFAYPSISHEGNITKISSLKIPEGMKFLFQHLLANDQIEDLKIEDESILDIYSKDVFQNLKTKDVQWESKVPARVVALIKEKALFGYQ